MMSTPNGLQVLIHDCYFTSAQAGDIVGAFSYGEDKVDAAVKVSKRDTPAYAAGLLGGWGVIEQSSSYRTSSIHCRDHRVHCA